MRPETTLFYDVDTQRDFMLADGKLYAPGSERILPALRQITQLARQKKIRIIASACRHFPGDAELVRNGGPYPDHCIDGTQGQLKVAETAPLNPMFIENRELTEPELRAALDHRGELIIEKQDVDVLKGNRNAEYLFEQMSRTYPDVVVYGVCTDICVDLAVRGLLRFGANVIVVVDAIAALDENRGKICCKSWHEAGVELVRLDQLRERLGN